MGQDTMATGISRSHEFFQVQGNVHVRAVESVYHNLINDSRTKFLSSNLNTLHSSTFFFPSINKRHATQYDHINPILKELHW